MTPTEFEAKQQELVDAFKLQLEDAAKKAIGTLYVDVTPYAECDAHLNYKNALWDEVVEDFEKEITSAYSWMSRAGSLRRSLLTNHKAELQNKIIEDLQAQVARLKQEIEQIYARRFT